MKINHTQKQLDSMLETAQARCTARTITTEQICTALKKVEDHLLTFSTKKDAIGTVVTVDYWAAKFPKAYKYTPESTHFIAHLTDKGWKVTSLYRDTCRTQFADIVLTPETKKNMATRLSQIGC